MKRRGELSVNHTRFDFFSLVFRPLHPFAMETDDSARQVYLVEFPGFIQPRHTVEYVDKRITRMLGGSVAISRVGFALVDLLVSLIAL